MLGSLPVSLLDALATDKKAVHCVFHCRLQRVVQGLLSFVARWKKPESRIDHIKLLESVINAYMRYGLKYSIVILAITLK